MTLPTLPYTFVSGATIYASQINANNSQIVADAAKGGANADITSLSGGGAGVAVHGTVTNDSAGTGYVGQYISSDIAFGSPVALTASGTSYDITHVSLTAGDWDVSAVGLTIPAGGTIVTDFKVWVSTSSAAASPTELNGLCHYGAASAGAPTGGTSGTVRFSLTTTTSVYLSVNATFSVSTVTGYGNIRARRVR